MTESIVVVHANAYSLGDPKRVLEKRINEVLDLFPEELVFDLEDGLDKNRPLKSYLKKGVRINAYCSVLADDDIAKICNSAERIFITGGSFTHDLDVLDWNGILKQINPNSERPYIVNNPFGCHGNVFKQIMEYFLWRSNKERLELVIPAELIYVSTDIDTFETKRGACLLSQCPTFYEKRIPWNVLFGSYIGVNWQPETVYESEAIYKYIIMGYKREVFRIGGFYRPEMCEKWERELIVRIQTQISIN